MNLDNLTIPQLAEFAEALGAGPLFDQIQAEQQKRHNTRQLEKVQLLSGRPDTRTHVERCLDWRAPDEAAVWNAIVAEVNEHIQGATGKANFDCTESMTTSQIEDFYYNFQNR
jgi:hypothetical protein